MTGKKRINQASQVDLFKAKVPKMPEGYYSGDKPNPNLRKFVEDHLKERPYDPETDDYDVPAFNKPIETTKVTAIYNMHTYWSKKPHDAIRQYIRHYTKPGDLVLDPMCGSGGTALAALMEGRKAIAIDRSPAATFITKNYCTPVDVEELTIAFEELKKKVKPEIDWLYETRCDRCGGKASTAYTVYSQVFQCPRCMEKVPLFDCVEIQGTTAKGKPKKISTCPLCHKRGIMEEISTRAEKFGAVPVLVSYLCESGCRPTRGDRRHNDSNKKKREYFEQYDLGKIREIEAKEIPHWYPKDRMMNAPDNQECWGVKWRAGTSNFRTVDELFTRRNLWALAAIRDGARDFNKDIADQLLFALDACILCVSRMVRESNTATMAGTYYLPQISKEVKVPSSFQSKLEVSIQGWQEIGTNQTTVFISNDSATRLNNIINNSIDYIFTDPPYAEKVQYGELNFIWEAWLALDTQWQDEEIIVNEVRGKTEDDWANMMRQAMAECYRVLKPGRCISLCYHDTSEGTWSLVQDIMAEVGFIAEKSDAALYIDTGQKSYNQLVADKVTKRDLIINFQKPKAGKIASSVTIIGRKDDNSFNEKVRQIIREYLGEHPGTTKDRIYDEVVSRMVRSGRMEAHDFDELLRQVADEVKKPRMKDLFTPEDPNLFGTHEISIWYLKETEAGAEDAEKAAAADATAKVQAFMVKYAEDQLRKSEPQWRDLNQKAEGIRQELARPFDEKDDKKRSRLRRELTELETDIEKLSVEQDEWRQHAVHYTYISEFYFPLTPKPRCTLFELLEDFFYLTDQGNWRPPATDAEKQEKAAARQKATRRTLQRYCRLLESGQAVPEKDRPDDQTLAEWIRHCKRSGLYEQGRLLYEKGGLNLDNFPEEVMVDVEEDYQVCVRMLGRESTLQTDRPKRRLK